jgi:uncharacterized protein YcfJ
MLRTCLIGIATASMALTAAPAMADRDRGYREYDDRGRYYEPRRVSSRDVWRGRDGRYYCRRGNGTTGLVIGAAGGALLGRAVDGGRDRATGTILGAAAGALLGREVQRSMRCR